MKMQSTMRILYNTPAYLVCRPGATAKRGIGLAPRGECGVGQDGVRKESFLTVGTARTTTTTTTTMNDERDAGPVTPVKREVGRAHPARDEREPRPFRELLLEAQAGSQEAAKELYETYVSHVVRCVRNRMWYRLRSKFDSQDFVQQVWASFFVGDTTLPDFQTPDDLIAYLMRLATNKVVMEGRRRRQPKNDARREELIDGGSDPQGPHPRTRLPTPSAVAVFREQYDQIVDQQQPETREIAELRCEGLTFEEIAEELEMHESSARKAMRRLKKRMRDER